MNAASQPSTTTTELTLHRARLLMAAILALRRPDFTGIGVVFYEDLHHLPHLQLTGAGTEPKVALSDSSDIAIALTSLSTVTCGSHDGFHFVEAIGWRLTHVSQFISPPIPVHGKEGFRATGARVMAGLLASLLAGVTCVGLVSQDGEVILFRQGVDVFSEK